MDNKKVVKINESQLKKIVTESTKKALNELANRGFLDAIKGGVKGWKTGAQNMSNAKTEHNQLLNKSNEINSHAQKAYSILKRYMEMNKSNDKTLQEVLGHLTSIDRILRPDAYNNRGY